MVSRLIVEECQQQSGDRQAGKSVPARFGILAAAAMALMLAGCGSSAVETFNLTAPESIQAGRSGRGQLVVMEPVATAPYNSDRLVVTTKPGSVAYLKGAQWSDQLPVLLQTRIVQSLENSGALRAVGRPGQRLVASTSLNTEIRRFDIDVESGQAVIELSAKMIHDSSGRVRAARIFSARFPASSTNGTAAAEALDKALSGLIRELVVWSVRRV